MGGTSDRAMKMFAVTQFIQKNNDNRNVFALSATPFTNSPIEIYNILSLIARKRLKELGEQGKDGLRKHAIIGAILASKTIFDESKVDEDCDYLVDTLHDWTIDLNIARLGKYGITSDDIDEIVEKSGLKNNPVKLSNEDIKTIIINRI